MKIKEKCVVSFLVRSMGSTGGKYTFECGTNDHTKNTNLPTVGYSSNRSKRANASIPIFLHRNQLKPSLSLTIIWLDTQINNQLTNIDMQIKLKNLSTYFRTYDRINSFEQYIESIDFSDDEELFLIISTTVALTLIPQIASNPQIKYIYIYGQSKIDPNTKQLLLKTYPKVRK